jgi:hypothetical protein
MDRRSLYKIAHSGGQRTEIPALFKLTHSKSCEPRAYHSPFLPTRSLAQPSSHRAPPTHKAFGFRSLSTLGQRSRSTRHQLSSLVPSFNTTTRASLADHPRFLVLAGIVAIKSRRGHAEDLCPRCAPARSRRSMVVRPPGRKPLLDGPFSRQTIQARL